MTHVEESRPTTEPAAEKADREHWFIDSTVQLAIFKRMFIYWIGCLLLFTLPIAILRSSFGAGPFLDEIVSVWKTHWPMIFTVLTFLPFVFYDVLKFSNRFVGPVYRLRRELEDFRRSGKVKKIRKFRDTDFWHDLYEGVNHLVDRIEELESQLEKKQASHSSTHEEFANT